MRVKLLWVVLELPKMVALDTSASLSQIPFSSWDSLYHRYLGIIEELDRFWEAYDLII